MAAFALKFALLSLKIINILLLFAVLIFSKFMHHSNNFAKVSWNYSGKVTNILNNNFELFFPNLLLVRVIHAE